MVCGHHTPHHQRRRGPGGKRLMKPSSARIEIVPLYANHCGGTQLHSQTHTSIARSGLSTLTLFTIIIVIIIMLGQVHKRKACHV